MSWQHCFRFKQPINYLIPWLTSVISATIGYIGYPLISFGKHYWHWWGTQCIFGHRQQSQHRRPDPNLPIEPVLSLASIGHQIAKAQLKNTIKSAKRSVQDFFLKLILSFQAVKLNAKCKLEGTVLKPREEAIQVKTYLNYFFYFLMKITLAI